MGKIPSRCPACGGALHSAPASEKGELRCSRCDGVIRTRAGGAGWQTARALAVGAMRGLILGVMASPLLVIVTGAGGSSDGTGVAILVALPVLGGVLGLLLGLAIPLLQRALSGPGSAHAEPAPSRTRPLILAAVAAAPPAVGVAVVLAGWWLCRRVPVTGSAPWAEEIIGSWAFVVCLAGPLGASIAVWALLSSWWDRVKHPEQYDAAPSRRRLAVWLALVALVLNVAGPWLFREGRLLPARDRYYEKSDKPSAVPISRSPGSAAVSPSGPRATPTARPEGGPRPQSPGAGAPPHP
jgi:hypothetical protein